MDGNGWKMKAVLRTKYDKVFHHISPTSQTEIVGIDIGILGYLTESNRVQQSPTESNRVQQRHQDPEPTAKSVLPPVAVKVTTGFDAQKRCVDIMDTWTHGQWTDVENIDEANNFFCESMSILIEF